MFSSSRQKTLGVSSLNPTWGKNSIPQRSPALQFVLFLQSCSKTFLNISHISDCCPGIAGLTPRRSFGMEPEERCSGDGDGRLCPSLAGWELPCGAADHPTMPGNGVRISQIPIGSTAQGKAIKSIIPVLQPAAAAAVKSNERPEPGC